KVKDEPPFWWALAPKSWETGTPAANVHTNPVPAHAMHLRKPRRSTPSPLGTSIISSCSLGSCFISPPALRRPRSRDALATRSEGGLRSCSLVITDAEEFYSR